MMRMMMMMMMMMMITHQHHQHHHHHLHLWLVSPNLGLLSIQLRFETASDDLHSVRDLKKLAEILEMKT